MNKIYPYPSHFYNKLSPFLKDLPINIDGMLIKVGINVSYDVPLPCIAEMLVSDIGVLIKISDEFSPQSPIVRFIKSFLLSHYMIHKGAIADKVTVSELFRTNLGKAKDDVAFKCAIDLIMPPIEIRRILNGENHTESIHKLARKFNVPKSLISIVFKAPYDEEK